MSPARSHHAQTDAQIDTALRALDAAPAPPSDEPTHLRAGAVLEGVLAQPRTPHGRVGRDPLLPRRQRTALRTSALALAAGIAVLGVATSQVLGGGTAYADSWTPVPTPAGQADIAEAQQACTESGDWGTGDVFKHLQPRLTERRGDLVLLVVDDGGARAGVSTCVVGLPPGGDAEVIANGSGGGARPAADAVTTVGIYEQSTPGDELSIIDGLAGEDVAAVTVHAPGGHVAQATVQGGHYAAWWPGLAMGAGTEASRSRGEGGCAGEGCENARLTPAYSLDVTLLDGTVLRDVPSGAL